MGGDYLECPLQLCKNSYGSFLPHICSVILRLINLVVNKWNLLEVLLHPWKIEKIEMEKLFYLRMFILFCLWISEMVSRILVAVLIAFSWKTFPYWWSENWAFFMLILCYLLNSFVRLRTVMYRVFQFPDCYIDWTRWTYLPLSSWATQMNSNNNIFFQKKMSMEKKILDFRQRKL